MVALNLDIPVGIVGRLCLFRELCCGEFFRLLLCYFLQHDFVAQICVPADLAPPNAKKAEGQNPAPSLFLEMYMLSKVPKSLIKKCSSSHLAQHLFVCLFLGWGLY